MDCKRPGRVQSTEYEPRVIGFSGLLISTIGCGKEPPKMPMHEMYAKRPATQTLTGIPGVTFVQTPIVEGLLGLLTSTKTIPLSLNGTSFDEATYATPPITLTSS